MGESSSIEWTHHTFNPWRGCTKATFTDADGKTQLHPPLPGVDWVIVGGESGPKARMCHVEWIRSVVGQCREAGVACFVKQIGRVPVFDDPATDDTVFLKDTKGGDWDEWPEDLRVRQFPGAGS